jgi:hypothetical protein
MSELLVRALSALGSGATAREIELVAGTLRTAGDKDVLGMLEAAAEDWRAFEALCRVAEEAGASGFVALDLASAVRGRLVR